MADEIEKSVDTRIEMKSFQAKGGKTYFGIRYPRKGSKGKKFHYRFFVRLPARRAVAELRGYSTTNDVKSNDYEKVWDEK